MSNSTSKYFSTTLLVLFSLSHLSYEVGGGLNNEFCECWRGLPLVRSACEIWLW